MLITTTDYIPGRKILEIKGVVKGSCVKARWFGKDIRGVGRSFIGGEMKYYTELLNDSRNTATQRMADEAQNIGANAVINVRYQTSEVAQGSAEVLAYGTAVVCEGDPGDNIIIEAQPAVETEDLSSKEIKCPKCSTTFDIPDKKRPIEVTCPNCGVTGVLD